MYWLLREVRFLGIVRSSHYLWNVYFMVKSMRVVCKAMGKISPDNFTVFHQFLQYGNVTQVF